MMAESNENYTEETDKQYIDGVKNKKHPNLEDQFVNLIQQYPCLMNNSQTPKMKSKKKEAVTAMEESIRKNLGITMNVSQIKKKIENMKSRVRQKYDKTKTGNNRIKIKRYEKKLLQLMDYKSYSFENNIQEGKEIKTNGVTKEEDVIETLEESDTSDFTSEVPHFNPFDTTLSNKNSNENCTVLQLQKDILQQQKEMNEQRKEIFHLQKEKLLMEIELIKLQKENLIKKSRKK